MQLSAKPQKDFIFFIGERPCGPTTTIKVGNREAILVVVASVVEEGGTIVVEEEEVVEDIFLVEVMIERNLTIILNLQFMIYANFMFEVAVVEMEIIAG